MIEIINEARSSMLIPIDNLIHLREAGIPHAEMAERELKLDFTLAELVPGEVALCIQQNEKLYAVIEHLEPAQAVQTLKDVLTGQISPDELSAREWREVDVRAARFKGMEKLKLPPLKDWPR